MIQLTKQQRDFFQYLKDNHRCMGYTGTIPSILDSGEYEETERRYLNDIVKDWKNNRANAGVMKSYGGLPTRYLK
jgi:hypothetical protein